MPNETEEDLNYIRHFVEDLSGIKNDQYEFIFGDREMLNPENLVPFDCEKLANLALESNSLTEENIDKNIRLFATDVFGTQVNGSCRQWLYDNLPRYEGFERLFKLCRGNAVSYDELLNKITGRNDQIGEKALENLLLLAPLAKDSFGNVLFPARMHSFFRGLNGVFCCLNPECSKKHSGDHIVLGDLFTSDIGQCPHCHAKVYELVNDRRCGALYLKGYVIKDSIDDNSFYYWQKKGIDSNHEMIEFPLYIVPEGYDLTNRPKGTRVGYLDVFSGKIYTSEPKENNYVTVLMSENFDEEGNAKFKVCPKCEKRFAFLDLSDFRIKGNMPFYNIVKAQFDAEPITKEPSKYLPNGGRKVLLFSDSRQSAAVLARDMTKLADMDSFRKAIFMAMELVYKEGQDNEIPLSALYPAFLQVSYENKLRFFYGNDLNRFEEDKKYIAKAIERNKKFGRPMKYEHLAVQLNTPSSMYQSDLIELFCSPTMNFLNLGLGYIVPMEDQLFDVFDSLELPNLQADEFEKIFLAFLYSSFVDSFAFDNTVPEETRKRVKYIKGNRYGFNHWKSYENEEVKKKYPNDYERIYQAIVETFYRSEDGYYFLNLTTVKMRLTPEGDKWTRCNKCGVIHPFNIDGHCSICDSTDIETVDCSKLGQIDYWRKPIFSKEPVKSLNTEEHTAQLSFKDEKINTWAKTEDYEMRFQDVNVEKEGTTPIDILSCTTTMEVGIDIGSLVAVGLRNVPPLRENYQQRAGRAGRRGTSLSTISTYAQGGPHDSYYFNHPEKIIKGKPRKPWIDLHNKKLIFRHYNLVVLTKYFETQGDSLYDCKNADFIDRFKDFESFCNHLVFSEQEINDIFDDADINECKRELIKHLSVTLSEVDDDHMQSDFFDLLFEKGMLPTYSFPLDVVSFNIEDYDRKLLLAPQRSLDIAISEYAPGRTIVIDKKTYKSGGIYNHNIRHETNIYHQAEPYFDGANGYYSRLYMCSNHACGWFSTEKPEGNTCPFCGQPFEDGREQYMLKPWGFAPLNGKEIHETEASPDMSYADDPCYSATPSNDLINTEYANLKIANRKNEEIIILNKGQDGNGFDVCEDCGAAQLHDGKSLKENGVGAPYSVGGRQVNCSHKRVAEGIYLGSSFRTDMFFMQVELDRSKITDDEAVLKSASITLAEAMKLAISRILDIEYNDVSVGTRTRKGPGRQFVDIYFYDSLSSGAGYSTQVGPNLNEILKETSECLLNPDPRDICNFWNQRIQYLFNKNLAYDLLQWIEYGELPHSFNESETKRILQPICSILENESSLNYTIKENTIVVAKNKYILIPALIKKHHLDTEFSDFDVFNSLPSVAGMILKN